MKDRTYFSAILSALSATLGAAFQQRKTPDSNQQGQTGDQQSAHKPPEQISEPQLQQNPLEAMRNLESVADKERRLADDENTLDFAGRTDFHARLAIATDGRIALYLSGDIQIDGLTSTEAAKAIEEHLRSQKLSFGETIIRDRRLAAVPSVETNPAERKIARTQPESDARQPATAARSEVPPTPARSPAPAAAAPAVSTRASAPPPTPRPGIRLPAFKPSIEPEAASEPEAGSASEIPWWLSGSSLSGPVPSGQVSDQPDLYSSAPAAQSAATSREPEMAPAKPRKEEVAAARMHEAEQAAIHAREAEIAIARNLEAALLAVRQREAALLAAQMRSSPQMETQQASEPRLTGLRNVLFSLGLNNLNRARVAEMPPPPSLPQDRREEPVPAYLQTSMPIVEHEDPVETARVVTAPPEFLPPQNDSARKDRQDRRDAYDEVEILPSWRGQYRRKG